MIRNLIARAMRELAENPESRAKAKQVYDEKLKPGAQKFYQEHEGEIRGVKETALRGAARLAVKVKKRFEEGRTPEDADPKRS